MGLFDFVEFGPEQVKAVQAGTADRRTLMAVMTSQTCGEACWHAREEVCRCSCGGKNHGCLTHGGERPDRTSKIGGLLYRLAAVGNYSDLYSESKQINNAAGYSYVDRPSYIIEGMGASYTREQWEAAKAEGKECWVSQYYGTWSETEQGAPARLKTAAPFQRNWPELSGWKEDRNVALLWVRVQMPDRPIQLKVDRDGIPLANQNPA